MTSSTTTRKALLTFCVFFLALFIWPALSPAQHMGGEIRWECLSNGNYRFITVLYRDCAGIQYPNTISLQSNSPAGSIPLYLWPNAAQGKKDISPACNQDTAFSHISCANTPSGVAYANSGAMQQWVYTSDQAFPNGVQLNAVPPPTGWIFSYSDCCRNPSNNILNTSTKSWFLHSIMKPYQNQNAYPCFDNSPGSAEPPQPISCAGLPSSYYQYADDKDLDQLSYSWAQVFNGSLSSPLSAYAPGYSFSSPLPGPVQDSNNIAAVLDPVTGMLRFRSHTPGSFLISQKITSRRQGVVIAEVFREMHLLVLPCDSVNLPPKLMANGNMLEDSVNLIQYSAIPGDTVKLTLSIFDTVPFTLGNGDMQTITTIPAGQQFGTGFISDTSGCPVKPCATLFPAPPYSDTVPPNITLTWPVTIDHMFGLGGQYLGYTLFRDFSFKIKDDYCPVPGMRNLLYRVKLDISPVVDMPSWHCIQHDTTGLATISWDTLGDPYNLFVSNNIYTSTSANGPWQLLDSITDPNITSYTHPGSGTNQYRRYYRVVSNFDYVGNPFSQLAFTLSSLYPQSPAEVCAGEKFMVDILGASPGDSIGLDPGVGTILSSSGNSYEMRIDSVGTYSFTVYRNNDCGQTSIRKSIKVNPLPIPGLLGPKYACPGQPTTLTAKPAAQYLWSNGSTGQSTTLPPQSGTAYVQLEITDSNQCRNAAIFMIRLVEPYEDEEVCMVSVMDPMTNWPRMIWDKTPGQDTRGYNLAYSSSLDPGTWTTFDYSVFNSPSNAGLVANASMAQYSFRIQVVDSCQNLSSWSAPVDQVFLTANKQGNDVYVSWIPAFDTSYLYRSIDGGPYLLLDTIINNISFLDISPPGNSRSYRLEIKGYYCTDYNGNVYSSIYSNTAQAVNPGLDELQEDHGISLTSDGRNGIWITFRKPLDSKARLHIFNLLGEEIGVRILNPVPGRQNISFPGLPKGIYICRITLDGVPAGGKKFIIR